MQRCCFQIGPDTVPKTTFSDEEGTVSIQDLASSSRNANGRRSWITAKSPSAFVVSMQVQASRFGVAQEDDSRKGMGNGSSVLI